MFSKLTIQFSIPRGLLPNENVVVSLGTDLSDVNTNTDRLNVSLFKIKSDLAQSLEQILIAASFD